PVLRPADVHCPGRQLLPAPGGAVARSAERDGRHLLLRRPVAAAQAFPDPGPGGGAADLRLEAAQPVTSRILDLAGANGLMLLAGAGLLPLLRLARTRRELVARLPLAYTVGLVATGVAAAELAVVSV